MKTIKLFIAVIFLSIAGIASSQVTVTFVIGAPPQWGPAGFVEANYYYLPDIETYYDVRSSMFIYQRNGIWIHRNYLPYRHRNYDLYRGYKVVLTDYHGTTPYHHFKANRHKYAKGYRGSPQQNIGERPVDVKHKQNARQKSKPVKKVQNNRSKDKGHK